MRLAGIPDDGALVLLDECACGHPRWSIPKALLQLGNVPSVPSSTASDATRAAMADLDRLASVSSIPTFSLPVPLSVNSEPYFGSHC